MARMTSEELGAAAESVLGGSVDPSGAADYITEKGAVIIAADANEIKKAFKRAKKIEGFRWVMINKEDLFAANTLSIGSKAGMIAGDGSVLKAAALPRKAV